MPPTKIWISFLILSIYVLECTTKVPSWSTMISSTRDRGNIVQIIPQYDATRNTSHVVVAFDGGTILDYNIFTNRVHFLNSEHDQPFSSNISSFGYLADLDVYYTGTDKGDIWQMIPDDRKQVGWNRVISNTSLAPISLILPFMRGGFFDLYFAAGNGELLQYNTFFLFGHVVYGDISSGIPTVALYSEYGSEGTSRGLVSGYSNGAIIKTTVGDGGAPVTSIIRAVGNKISSMLAYKNYQQNLLVVSTSGSQAQIAIYSLDDNSPMFTSPFYTVGIQALHIYSNLVTQEDYLVFGFADGTIKRMVISNLQADPSPPIETLATSELFGGFPITVLQSNWLADSTGALFAATEYGTISALLTNDTNWKMLATPLSWESPQHILDLQFLPTQTLNQASLTALLDQGEISVLNAQEWGVIAPQPSQTDTQFQRLLYTQEFPRSFRPPLSPTGPVSFGYLKALVDNNIPFNIVLNCQTTTCAASQLTLAVQGYEIYSQAWRQDGQMLIVTNSLSGQSESILYDSLSSFIYDGDMYVWYQTTF